MTLITSDHICLPLFYIHKSGIRVRDFSLYKSAPLYSESIFSISTEDWRLHFLCWSWNTEDTLLEKSRLAQSRAEQREEGGVNQTGAELSSQRGALPLGCLALGPPHSHAVPQLCYFTVELQHYWAVLFSKPCRITIELFVLNKVSLCTKPQARDSCWHWIGVKDHWSTPEKIGK